MALLFSSRLLENMESNLKGVIQIYYVSISLFHVFAAAGALQNAFSCNNIFFGPNTAHELSQPGMIQFYFPSQRKR